MLLLLLRMVLRLLSGENTCYIAVGSGGAAGYKYIVRFFCNCVDS